MDVSAAVNKRSSIRQFRPYSISDDMLRGLLADASRAPSGGNLQPWRIYVVNGNSMNKLRKFLPTQPPLDEPEYDIYPKGLLEPYRTNRFGIGEQMYATLGIEREDKAGRQRQLRTTTISSVRQRQFFVMSIVRWVCRNGLTLECFYRRLCCLQWSKAWQPARRSIGRCVIRQSAHFWGRQKTK